VAALVTLIGGGLAFAHLAADDHGEVSLGQRAPGGVGGTEPRPGPCHVLAAGPGGRTRAGRYGPGVANGAEGRPQGEDRDHVPGLHGGPQRGAQPGFDVIRLALRITASLAGAAHTHDHYATPDRDGHHAAQARDARPDFASVNLSEPGPGELAEVLQAAGIAVEAGVWSVADVAALAAAGTRVRWLRILVEIMGAPAAGAEAAADAVLGALDEAGVTGPRLLHGEDAACWPLIAHAGRRGLPTRAGLEDTTAGPGGAPAGGNAELIRQALELWTAAAPG
jgi:hypothetical protein